MKVAVVYWGDACASDPMIYFNVDECKEIKAIASVDCGFLVRDDKDGVVLARHSSESGFRGMMFIPRKMIYGIKIYGRARG